MHAVWHALHPFPRLTTLGKGVEGRSVDAQGKTSEQPEGGCGSMHSYFQSQYRSRPGDGVPLCSCYSGVQVLVVAPIMGMRVRLTGRNSERGTCTTRGGPRRARFALLV